MHHFGMKRNFRQASYNIQLTGDIVAECAPDGLTPEMIPVRPAMPPATNRNLQYGPERPGRVLRRKKPR
jgi:hypothetical protein